MMEQDESARFEGENGLKIHPKPVIPEKPKGIPPPLKVSNPFVSSLNAAVRKGEILAPRVVFKDDKNLSRQLSPPWGSKPSDNQFVNNTELLDNQKKEVNAVKQNLKDKNLPLVSPMSPKIDETSEPESSPRTPVSAIPAKWSTPKKFVFNPPKATKVENNQTEHNKGVEVTKKSMKDRNFPLVLPVVPKKVETSEPEPSLFTHVSVPPSTPKSSVITPQTASKVVNENADVTKEVNVAKKSIKERNLPLVLPTKADTPEVGSNPNTPMSISPIKVSTPKSFVFTTSKTSNEKPGTVESSIKRESPIPASRTPAPHPPTLAASSVAAIPSTESVPVVPKAVVPSQTSVVPPSVPNTPASSIPPPSIPTSVNLEPKILKPKILEPKVLEPKIPESKILEPKIPESKILQSKIPEPVIPTPVIPVQTIPKIPKPDPSFTTLADTEPLKPNINMLNLSEVFPPPEGSPPAEFTDIPPPLLEDYPDGDLFEQIKPIPAIRTSIPPISRSPDISRLASTPALSTYPVVSSEPLVNPLDVHTVVKPVDVVLENTKVLTDSPDSPDMIKEEHPSTKPLSPLSALARAEEMASVKRTPPDSRIFNLLERAKRKSTAIQLATTPEHTTPIETVTPEKPLPETPTTLPETFTTEVTQPKVTPPEKALPQLATTVKALHEETPPVAEVPVIPDLPPVDYVDRARFPPKVKIPELPKVNGLDNRVLTVVKPVHPPPPPPRKALPATPMVDPLLEKPTPSPAPHLQIPKTPSEHLETHEGSLHDSSFGEIFYDAEEPATPAVSTFRPPSVPSSSSTPKRPLSGHEEAILKQRNPKPQVKDVVPLNMEDMDYGSMNSGSPSTEIQAAVLKDSMQISPALSPSGTLERADNVFEDYTENKKGKTIKNKKQKGPPKNPYADTAAQVQEAPKKSLFTRKNSAKAVDEKEQKKKDKQREKEKEKEKEREKKEQKEKEKKESEIRKRFKITGQEEPIYHVKVIEDCKGRKNDLPVKVGDTVNIIRTENCPKGKWLAKDNNNTYGYIPVECVDLNINGIMELGKKTTVSNRSNGNGHKDTEANSTNSRSSEHYNLNHESHESFSEDSEEWTCEDDDPAFGTPDETAHVEPHQSQATPAQDVVDKPQIYSTYNVQAKQEALHKLSSFFMQPKTPSQLPQQSSSRMPEPKPAHEGDSGSLVNEEEGGLDTSDLQILPPPDLYADLIAGDSGPVYTKPIKLVQK
ncbi:mucin-2 [Danio aesculapii]|uniref:mucin-2 n=1 Tax=Danio aesculapii TaxID=1142201 RepID=UPI0024BF1FBC|nr:mucin-2 [Danio aesculapii]